MMEMLKKFFHAIELSEEKPQAICFYTEGVKTTAKGSPLESSLKFVWSPAADCSSSAHNKR